MKVDCAEQLALLTQKALLRVGLSPAAKMLYLKGRFRRRGCGRRGRAVVSISGRTARPHKERPHPARPGQRGFKQQANPARGPSWRSYQAWFPCGIPAPEPPI
jgi:hypothetical protein